MTYNREELLKMLSTAPLHEGSDFHEGYNSDFIKAMDDDFLDYYNYAHGATKFVLIPVDTNTDYVIKIPYTGSFNHESGYYYHSYYHYGREDYWDYTNGDDLERPWDYCANEVHRYKIANENYLSECFAETKLLGFVNNYPIYIQEKGIIYSSCPTHSYSDKEIDKTSRCCNNYRGIDRNWLTDFRFYYGEEKLLKFTHFIHENRWDDDLRLENIGYIEDRPVLIDYSGFLE